MNPSQGLRDLSKSNDHSPLLRLPQELLIRVASYLTTPELGHLRRSCKDVESRLFESFAYEFFHKRQFMIEEPSLQALIDISNHPTLSKRLTEVIIGTTQYREMDDLDSTTAQRLLPGGYVHHNNLVASGQARDMLVEAFRNLPRLRSVGLRDYDAKGRYRDGDKAMWRSYGHSLAQVSPGDAYHIKTCPPEQAWVLLLQAVSTSGVMVPSVEVFLRHDARLSDKAFDVLSGRMCKTMAPLLAQLKTLMLTISTERTYSRQSGSPEFKNIRLKQFLHHTPAIEHLRLNFDDAGRDLLDWLGLSPKSSNKVASQAGCTLDDYAAPVSFPNLTMLDLGMVHVYPAILLKALTRFNLKSFNLWRVVLKVDSSSDVKPAAGDANAATKFIEKLGNATATQHVQSAMVGYLKVNNQKDPRQRELDVNFPPVTNGSSTASKPASRSSGKKDGDGSSAPPKKAEHQVIGFNLGGRAPNFAVWAKEMAGRAVIVRLHHGYEVPDLLESEEEDLDDSEGDEDMEDEDGEAMWVEEEEEEEEEDDE